MQGHQHDCFISLFNDLAVVECQVHTKEYIKRHLEGGGQEAVVRIQELVDVWIRVSTYLATSESCGITFLMKLNELTMMLAAPLNPKHEATMYEVQGIT